jgi:hypothetical protein
MQYPSFPTSSLTGSFPGFPVDYVSVPNIIDLPSYIANTALYYTDVINYPYAHPPILQTWQIPYPNLTGIGTWLYNIVLWLMGWVGALLEWGITYLSALVVNAILGIINLGAGTLTAIITLTTQTGDTLGIFAIPFEATIAGLLVILVVLLLWGVINLVQKVIEVI